MSIARYEAVNAASLVITHIFAFANSEAKSQTFSHGLRGYARIFLNQSVKIREIRGKTLLPCTHNNLWVITSASDGLKVECSQIHWQTVYGYFWRWKRQGLWERINITAQGYG